MQNLFSKLPGQHIQQMIFHKSVIVFLICFSHYLMAQNSVDSLAVLQIGGIRQVISIKGKDSSKPLLLFLHGVPGNSVMHYAQSLEQLRNILLCTVGPA